MECAASNVKTNLVDLYCDCCIPTYGPLCIGVIGIKQSNISEVESRTQGSRPRPRTQKKSEAKAKDTKKIRGQGQEQPFRGQTLSRPRTGMLEAKAKDQGHSRKCFPKKRSSKKFFRQSPIYRRSQNF